MSKRRKKALPSFCIHVGGDFLSRQTVPEAPTMAMLEAAAHALDGVDISKYSRKDKAIIKAAVRWHAMLKAAPKL